MIIKLFGYNVIIDDEDYELIMGYNWLPRRNKSTPIGQAYFRSTGYDCHGKAFTIYIHRIIMGCIRNDNNVIDHISGNILDCQKSNLRKCTHSENGMNRGMQKNNANGYKGISWNNEIKKYRSRIMLKKQQIHLGYYETPEQAAIEYNKAAIKYHGEFARLNIVL